MSDKKNPSKLPLEEHTHKHNINTKLANSKQILINIIDEIIENGDSELKHTTLHSIRDIQHLFVEFFYPSESRSSHHTKGKLRRVKSFSETSVAHSENSIEDFDLDDVTHVDQPLNDMLPSPILMERPKTGRTRDRRKSERRLREDKKVKAVEKSLKGKGKVEFALNKSKGGKSPKMDAGDKSRGKIDAGDKSKVKLDAGDKSKAKKRRSSKLNLSEKKLKKETDAVVVPDTKEDDDKGGENKLRKMFNLPKREKQLVQSGNTFVAGHFGYESDGEIGPYHVTFVDNHLWKEGLNYEYDVMEMHVERGDKEWIIFRRWKAYQKLDQKLKKKGLLPPSIFMKKPKKIEKAIAKLAEYLRVLLEDEDISTSQYIYNFLGPFQVGDTKPDTPEKN